MRSSSSDVVELIAGQSPSVASELIEPLVRCLALTRELFAGDLDKALIMMVITLRSSQHPAFRKLSPDGLAAGDVKELPGLGTNIRSLAASTCIPRESVRRKVGHLLAAGWVERDGRRLRYSVQGYLAVAPIRDEVIRMYASGFRVVAGLAAASKRSLDL